MSWLNRTLVILIDECIARPLFWLMHRGASTKNTSTGSEF